MDVIQFVLCTALRLYWVVLIVRIILSWVPAPPEPVRPLARGVHALTDPLLVPLRGILPPIGGGGFALDLSPIVLFFGIYLLQTLLCSTRGLL